MKNIMETDVDLFGDTQTVKPDSVVAQRFIEMPFTILDTKSGRWNERKRAWKNSGIDSELGRDTNSGEMSDNATMNVPKINGFAYNKDGTKKETELDGKKNVASIFDPVLCELAYTWFSKAGSQVVDCFAGGSVRGVVAGSLDRKYYGIDLREEQIKANVQQAKDLIPNADVQYVCGDSNALIKNAPDADFIFSCPPYGDLEVYSDKEDDLSNMPDVEFDKVYANIIKQTCDRLKDDRFACFVVGDYRDKDGNYTNFTGKTVQAFLDAGLKLYNEAILATPIGTAMLRAGKQFDAKRKLVKTHQNVYVFLKGDARKASNYVMDK